MTSDRKSLLVAAGGDGAPVLDIIAWGWFQLFLGAAIGFTGFGLIVGNEVARVLRAILEQPTAGVQGVLPMELGGFEPPTSWVRSRSVVHE